MWVSGCERLALQLAIHNVMLCFSRKETCTKDLTLNCNAH